MGIYRKKDNSELIGRLKIHIDEDGSIYINRSSILEFFIETGTGSYPDFQLTWIEGERFKYNITPIDQLNHAPRVKMKDKNGGTRSLRFNDSGDAIISIYKDPNKPSKSNKFKGEPSKAQIDCIKSFIGYNTDLIKDFIYGKETLGKVKDAAIVFNNMSDKDKKDGVKKVKEVK